MEQTNPQNQQKDEKLLPLGEPTLRFNPPPSPMPALPSKRAQSWGTVISIVIIVLMIIVGAFYAWGKRIAENEVVFPSPTSEAQ